MSFILLALAATGQDVKSNPPSPRPGFISAIQEFEKSWGFQVSKNFRSESPQLRAYFLCYSTGVLDLPISYDGLRLEPATEAGCKADGRKRDLFFYPVEALAGKSGVTSALSEASDERRAVVVAHEDFHAVTNKLPALIAEAATTLVGFLTAAEFARAQFGEGSGLYRNLSQEPELFLRKAGLVRAYHARLARLYTSVRHGNTSATAALAEKQQVFDELGRRCREISPEPQSFNRCPPVLNNAGLAFDMTYANYYPVIYEMYVDHDRNLKLTIQILKQLATGARAAGELERLRAPQEPSVR
jgi:hypothetical protein